MTDRTRPTAGALSPQPPSFLGSGGEMGALIRAHDWGATSLGPIDSWPQSLRTSVSTCLDCAFPILVWWGADLVMLYNDEYRPILGSSKHPAALGAPGQEVWPEIWDVIGPMLAQVMTEGKATRSRDLLLVMDRNGYTEETYFSFSYSPIRDESGAVGGVFCPVIETTDRVLSERRQSVLSDLAETAATAQTKSVTETEALCLRVLENHRADVPFALLYRFGDDRTASLVGIAGVPVDPDFAPAVAPLDHAEWPFAAVQAGERGFIDLTACPGGRPTSPWGDPVGKALVLPIPRRDQGTITAALVLGINPRRALDPDHQQFLDRVAGAMATAVANARAFEAERERAETLAELDRAKTQFFSNISHEFRTPLTLLLGPLEELIAQSPPAMRDLAGTAHRNGLRLLRLVNTLLDFSRIEAGRLQARFAPTDLGALTADLASNFRSAFEKAGLDLVIDCPALTEPVYVDEDFWEKIVLNLLSNAFKFTLKGSVTVRLEEAQGVARLTVADTGVGIPADELPRLFERFHRIEGQNGRSFEGSGIGLALVRELVTLQGGTITADSAPGRGTTFTVGLPFGRAHLPADQVSDQVSDQPAIAQPNGDSPAARAQAYAGEALHWLPDAPGLEPADGPAGDVLLVEDNADMRGYVTRLLTTERLAVRAVGDGAAALAAARQRRPDLILSDVMMPGLDGFGLLSALRADPSLRDIPVVLLSARAGEEARVEGLKAGADDYLTKPFTARELVARVRANLTLARARRAAVAVVRANEEGLKFRVELDARLRDLVDPRTIVDAATDLLGRHLGVGRCGYGELDATGALFTVDRDWTDGAMPSFKGCWRLDNFGPAIIADYRAGRVVRLDDALSDDRTRNWADAYAAIGPVRAGIGVPLVKDGRLVAGFYVHQSAPRRWTDEEETLVRDVAERTWAAVERGRVEVALRHRSHQLQELADTALAVSHAPSLQAMLDVVTQAAQRIIGAHQGVVSLSAGPGWQQSIPSVALSNRYAAWRGYDTPTDGTGIYALVCEGNRPLRMTQAELEAHPRWRGFGGHAKDHPPMRGWLAAPLVGRDGRNLGLIQVSDKADGADFDEADEAMLVQLAQIASAAIERTQIEAQLRDLNDTLERRIAEALTERKLFGDIVEGTDAFVQLVDSNYRWLAINKAAADEFEQAYGVRPKVGDSMLDLLAGHGEQQAAVKAVWSRALAGEEFTDVRDVAAPGRPRRWYEMRFNALHGTDGQRIGAYQFAHDVTQRLQEQSKLVEAQAQLHEVQKLETIGQLTGGVAHDFNNLLMAVLGNLELLRKRLPADPTTRRLLDGATQGAQRGSALTQRLLAFARRQDLQAHPVDLGGLLDGIADLLERSVGPLVVVRFVKAPALPPAMVDPNQLELAILNLAVNARDAMPDGGTLTLSVEETSGGDIPELPPGAHLRLSVRDTGVGMDAATLARAVEPFFSTKGIGKGTGLGLSMVHGLAVQSGGMFRLSSTPGQGTLAELWLPVAAEAEAHSAESAEPTYAFAVAPPSTILLVDDDPLIAMSATDMLTDLGHTVIEANAGPAALALLRAGNAVDLLVTDYAMPGMTGVELALEARAIRPDLPVLLATGYADLPEGTATDLPRLAKPYTQNQLAAAVARLLGEALRTAKKAGATPPY